MAATTSADRGREVRRRLLAAATGLIAERGWPGVSTRVLAERAGVAPGLVHYHFASLQALLTEAAIGVLRGLTDGLTPLLNQAGTPEEALDLLLGSLASHTGHDPVSLVFTETYLAATRDEELRRAVGGVLADFRRELARWLGEHEVESPAETAAVLAAAVDGVLLHRALDPGLTAETVAPVLRRTLTKAGRRTS
ncbi:TetR/AcrR family transcriptional regulator [Amycolatopsis nigrescens]|uniref:TetR/AcrR family transcriptional regulator n=1 Tax=Amycolatopsis nigrescens TaxID=381445 RepID=UPI00036C8984|nr:TetR/AcrR family transcriptional regulator [Amycolatopsis nigrescens]